MLKEINKFEKLEYIITYPDGYTENRKYPVILMLHGAGGRGTEIEKISNHYYFRVIENFKDFPFISVAPQCYADSWFDIFESLISFAKMIQNAKFTDKSRFYVMGASMGGYATWQLAMSLPEVFAAIVPVCGGGMYWNAARLKNIPVWAFHGKLDTTVFLEESIKMVDATNRAGGNAKLTIYPETAHNSWGATYPNPEIYEWMLSHTNHNVIADRTEYNDTELYG